MNTIANSERADLNLNIASLFYRVIHSVAKGVTLNRAEVVDAVNNGVILDLLEEAGMDLGKGILSMNKEITDILFELDPEHKTLKGEKNGHLLVLELIRRGYLNYEQK